MQTTQDQPKSIFEEITAEMGKKELSKFESALKRGEDVEQTDNNGNTPLHKAVRLKNKECIEILLKYGASINTKNVCPTHFLLYNIQHILPCCLTKQNDGQTPLDLLDKTKHHALYNYIIQTSLVSEA